MSRNLTIYKEASGPSPDDEDFENDAASQDVLKIEKFLVTLQDQATVILVKSEVGHTRKWLKRTSVVKISLAVSFSSHKINSEDSLALLHKIYVFMASLDFRQIRSHAHNSKAAFSNHTIEVIRLILTFERDNI